jgi:hypothetical protein
MEEGHLFIRGISVCFHALFRMVNARLQSSRVRSNQHDLHNAVLRDTKARDGCCGRSSPPTLRGYDFSAEGQRCT